MSSTRTGTPTKVAMAVVIAFALVGGIVAGGIVAGNGNTAGAQQADGSTEGDGNGGAGDGNSGGSGSVGDGTTPPGPTPTSDDQPTIEVGDDATVVVHDDGTTGVVGTVDIPTSAGPVQLRDADLVIEDGPDGLPIIVGGTAEVPFPTTGVLAEAVINHVPTGLVGTNYGRDLHHLGAHLQDDRLYVWFHFDGGLDIELPFAGQPGFEAVPATIEVPVGVSATLVLDPNDPYFYVGTPCPDVELEDNDNNNDTDRNRDDEDDSERDEEMPDQDALVTLEPIGGVGQDCGVGFSLQGLIPAPTAANADPFFGHVVVDAIVPLPYGMELDGSVVVEIRDDAARTSGTGDLSATLPLVDALIDIQLPIGGATVNLEATAERLSLAFDGMVGGTEPTYELPLIGVPFTLPTDGSIRAEALLAWDIDAAGRLTVAEDSFVEIDGRFEMGFGQWASELGLSLGSSSVDANLRIDRAGVRLVGSAEATLHPALSSNSSLTLDAFLSFGDIAESYVSLDGELVVAGVTLGEAAVDLSNEGLFVAGMLTNTIATVELRGEISPAGINLSGSQSLEFPLDVLQRFADAAISGIDAAQAEVDRLQDEIDRLREEVRQGRRDRDATFQQWTMALEIAQADLDVIDENIRINNQKISGLRSDIQAEIRRYNNLNLGEQLLQSIEHGALLTAWNAAIAGFELANVTQLGYRETANLVLQGAIEGLALAGAALDAIPVDTDPRIIALFAAKETATLVLQTARAGADLVNVGGTLRAEITWQLGTDGLGGAAVAELCTDTCTTIVGASVTVLPVPEACVEVVGIPACVGL